MTNQERSYPQTYTTIGRALRSVRATVWNSSQLVLLDQIIVMLADDFTDLNPRFDTKRFKETAAYRHGRVDVDEPLGKVNHE